MNGSENMRKETSEDLCMTRKYYDMPCRTCILNNLPYCPEYKTQRDINNEITIGKIEITHEA